MSCETNLENTEELPVITSTKEQTVKHKEHPTLIAFLIGICIGIGAYFGYKKALPDITAKIVQTYGVPAMIESAAESTGLSDDQMESIIEMIPESDRQTIVDILARHIDSDNILEIRRIAHEEGKSGLLAYANESLDEAEREQVRQILSSNMPAILARANQYGVDHDSLLKALPDLVLAEQD